MRDSQLPSHYLSIGKGLVHHLLPEHPLQVAAWSGINISSDGALPPPKTTRSVFG